MQGSLSAWSFFTLFILGMLALDLGVFHKKAHIVKAKEAAIWSTVWISISILFGLVVMAVAGKTTALEFYTGYVIEKTLSLDNLFVIVLIFKMQHIPKEHQHRVLFWGILGAIVMRALMILAGIKLIETFHWLIYVFGFFLIYAAISTVTNHMPGEEAPESPVLKWIKKKLPISSGLREQHFFVFENGKWFVTPLFVSLLFIEFADLMFAIDSIPAILAITRDPFIVYSSNILAILGLRSLYFLLADIIPRFYYIHHALAVILGFVGAKMLMIDLYAIPIAFSLTFIALVFLIAVIASLLRNRSQAS